MSDKIKIYWSPSHRDPECDWNILYYKPNTLNTELKKIKHDELKNENTRVFQCPAVSNLTRKTIVIKNTIESHYKFMGNNVYEVLSKNFMSITLNRPSQFKNCHLFEYEMNFLFFSEEDVLMTLTSPYFSKCPHLQYGAIIPGQFNISKWFRPLHLEFNLWPNIDEFKINKDEDIAYINFNCNKDIELIRFDVNEKLLKISKTLSTVSGWEKLIPLKERYEKFKKTQLNKIIIKEIKNNIVE
jgi:hypothetical protein